MKHSSENKRLLRVRFTICKALTNVLELMKEYKRNIDKSIRDLERERTKMQQQEKKLIADMRRMAKQNQMVYKQI